MADVAMQNLPIDAVITWVDGADPKHIEKLNTYLSTLGGGMRPRAANPIRFHHSGELDYCVTSLLRFSPWIRKIFIVTDAQTPEIIHKIKGSQYEERVVVVDHKEIYCDFEHFLPTFNSNSISAMLWRIPDLSEQFLFLNDDFALIRPLRNEDFFRQGKVVLRGSWRHLSENSWRKRLKKWVKELSPVYKSEQQRTGYLAGQELTAKSLGFDREYFQIPHNPHAWRVSTLKSYYESNRQLWDFNISFPLRSSEQSIVEALSAHLELRADNVIIDKNLKTLQLKPADQALIRIKHKLNKADNDVSTVFVCVQSIEKADETTQKLIFSWLDRRVGSIESLIQNTNGPQNF